MAELYYFPLMAKGLGPTLTMEFSGLSWKGAMDLGFDPSGWPTMKESGATPFGQLPLLVIDGLRISQTTAVINYIARKAPALEGSSAAEYATSQMLMAEAEDIYNALQKSVPTKFVKLGQKGKGDVAAHEEFWASTIPSHLGKLEALLGGAETVASMARGQWQPKDDPTAGELHLFSMLHQMVVVRPNVLDATPKLKGFYESILNKPNTQKVLSGASSFGPLAPYFVKVELE
mmetsp:Transcript_39306/g.92432  ORF Transcript_39306/g.92432 Transcript_39306/m.92432 type:complete len:232 (+) Transcript_39306:3-698(+)